MSAEPVASTSNYKLQCHYLPLLTATIYPKRFLLISELLQLPTNFSLCSNFDSPDSVFKTRTKYIS